MDETPFRGFISYLSNSKLEQIHSSLNKFEVAKSTETTETKMGAKLGASVSGLMDFLKAEAAANAERRKHVTNERFESQYQKLSRVVEHFSDRNFIASLEDAISGKKSISEQRLFSYSGEFWIHEKSNLQQYIEEERAKEDAIPYYYARARARARMCVIESTVGNYKLLLACSLKYFGDMGGSRSFGEDGEEDEWYFYPHSGNHFFFDGDVSSDFCAIFYISQVKENVIFGSPLVLYQSHAPEFE